VPSLRVEMRREEDRGSYEGGWDPERDEIGVGVSTVFILRSRTGKSVTVLQWGI
jgi:hypothetical protein